jgi:hypothetical protein
VVHRLRRVAGEISSSQSDGACRPMLLLQQRREKDVRNGRSRSMLWGGSPIDGCLEGPPLGVEVREVAVLFVERPLNSCFRRCRMPNRAVSVDMSTW